MIVRYWEYHVLRRYADTEGRSEVSPGRRHHGGESRPANTTTGYENRIREFAAEHGIPISRGKVQRLALKLAKRDGATNHGAIDFWRVFGFADPTPSEAIHNLEHTRPGAH